MKAKRTESQSKTTLTCPLCNGELKNRDLRLYKKIVYCTTGAVSLGYIEVRLIQALLRSMDGLTTMQFADLVGTTTVNVNSRVKQLNMKMKDIGWKLTNIAGRGPTGALYVLREISE